MIGNSTEGVTVSIQLANLNFVMASSVKQLHFCSTTVGQKYIVAVTGLMLSGFVLLHLTGNLLLFMGPATFNEYSHQLTHNLLFLYSAESILFSLFLIHLSVALKITWNNRRARGEAPVRPQGDSKSASFASRSMALTGLLILVFLIWHLKTLRFGPYYEIVHNGVTMRDMYRLVIEEFSELEEVIFYCFSMLVLWTHLSHGISALFQTLGVGSSKLPWLRRCSLTFATLITVGFASLPLILYLRGRIH